MTSPRTRKGPGLLARLCRALAACVAAVVGCFLYTWITLPDVRSLRTTNPVTTAFMRLRAEEDGDAGREARASQHWVPYGRISPALKRAVIVAEDSAFWDHKGIDVAELKIAIDTYWRLGGVLRGSSTITQQLAKNLYLSPSRNPWRKITELMIARRLEAELSKTRIFELYLNLIEWGDGIWGAEAASRIYFNRSAADLSAEQAALLAGAIINPRVYSPAHPRARLLRRQRIILARMGGPTQPTSSVPRPLPADDLKIDVPQTEAADEPRTADPAPAPAPETANPEARP